jgi:hypothetical protein
MTFLERYLSGDHYDVWRELEDLGPVPPDHEQRADVDAVATETMRRVSGHVRRIEGQLRNLGFQPAEEVNRAINDGERADLVRIEKELGGLPAALKAMYLVVGPVSFMGDCPALHLSYSSPLDLMPDSPEMPPSANFPDPLVLPSVTYLRDEIDWKRSYEGFRVDFAPDELHKANVSGDHGIDFWLPDTSANPQLFGTWGDGGFGLVNYLREALYWGGFPGYQHEPDAAPPALARLQVKIDF